MTGQGDFLVSCFSIFSFHIISKWREIILIFAQGYDRERCSFSHLLAKISISPDVNYETSEGAHIFRGPNILGLYKEGVVILFIIAVVAKK